MFLQCSSLFYGKKFYNIETTKMADIVVQMETQSFIYLLVNWLMFWQPVWLKENTTIEHIRKRSEAGLLSKSSRLAPPLGATKFVPIIAMILVTLCCAN